MIVDLSKLQPPAEPPRPRLRLRDVRRAPTFQETEHHTWTLMRFYSGISLRMEPYRTAARPCEERWTAPEAGVYQFDAAGVNIRHNNPRIGARSRRR